MSDTALSMTASFDRQLVRQGGRSARYLVVDLLAPELPAGDNRLEQQPLNLALVIDVSSSMAGHPLACAKAAAIGVVNALPPSSRLSILSFARHVHTHLAGASLEGVGRERALEAVEQLVPRDSTNLGAGWLTAATCVAQVMDAYPDMHNHIVLLSDGHANTGIVDPFVLGHHAQELRSRGVLTSTVGIGDHYSSAQLQSLADSGGGQLHDAQFPHEIIEVVIGGLQEVQETFIKDIVLQVDWPRGTRFENLSGFQTKIDGDSALVQMGMLAPSRKRHAIFRFGAPEGFEGEQLTFRTRCSWTDSRVHRRIEGTPVRSVLTFASEMANGHERTDEVLGLRVAQCWQSGVVRKSVALNRLGELGQLARYLDSEIKYLSRYCLALPKARHLVSELESLRARADREWNERSRKTMDHTTYLQSQTYYDYRSMVRGGWTESLDSL